MMPATRNKLLARLHCIKKEHGWDDAEYRDILQARSGARSGADLDDAALARVVAALGAQKPRNAPSDNEWHWVNQAPQDRVKRLRYIIVLAGQIGIRRGGQKRYVEGIAENMDSVIRVWKDGKHVGDRSCAVKKPLEFCTFEELADIINALEAQVKRVARRTVKA